MRKIAAAISVLLATTVVGSAADLLPLKTAPAPSVFTWDGFYLGVSVGDAWGSNSWTSGGVFETPAISTGNANPSFNHVLGGVQGGANYQIGSWVAGIEADVSALGAKGSDTATVSGIGLPGVFTTADSQIDWLALFTGRLGYAWDRALFYAKGGVAAGDTKDSFALFSHTGIPAFLDFGTKTNLMVGWTVGGGIEYAFAPRWTAKIEYDYVDLGTNSENFNILSSGATVTFREDINHTANIVKFGANYRFF
jgi:outer membrane immunogenic protein